VLHGLGAGRGANLQHGRLALVAREARGAQLDQLVGGERPLDFGKHPRRDALATDQHQRGERVGACFQPFARGR